VKEVIDGENIVTLLDKSLRACFRNRHHYTCHFERSEESLFCQRNQHEKTLRYAQGDNQRTFQTGFDTAAVEFAGSLFGRKKIVFRF
jgi:hypothetical protein